MCRAAAIPRVLRRVAAAALVTCFCAASLRAHEIGTTRVSVVFADDGTYQIEIVTDAAALVEKLEASSGSSSPAETQADRLQTFLRSFDETFRKRVNIAFDGVEVQPTATYSVTTAVDNSSAASATIRVEGTDSVGCEALYVDVLLDVCLLRPHRTSRFERKRGDRMAGGQPEERAARLVSAISAYRSPRHRLAVSDARLHAHRAQGAGSRALRTRDLLAEVLAPVPSSGKSAPSRLPTRSRWG